MPSPSYMKAVLGAAKRAVEAAEAGNDEIAWPHFAHAKSAPGAQSVKAEHEGCGVNETFSQNSLPRVRQRSLV
jgi:hypothetical protein